MKNKIVLTGAPGSGKTTLLTRLVKRYETLLVGGFTTEEILENDQRVGFRLRTVEGDSAIIAHVEYQTPHRVGDYGVEPRNIRNFGIKAVRRALTHSQLVVIDEIADMQLAAHGFKKTVLRALGSKRVVLATVHEKNDPFTDQLKHRRDVHLVTVTPQNREAVYKQIVAMMNSLLAR